MRAAGAAPTSKRLVHWMDSILNPLTIVLIVSCIALAIACIWLVVAVLRSDPDRLRTQLRDRDTEIQRLGGLAAQAQAAEATRREEIKALNDRLVAETSSYKDEITALQQAHAGDVKTARKDAINRSGSVLKGKVMEQFGAVFPEFPFDPRDARFLGGPVDFVVFDGLSDGELMQVVFVEIKTAQSKLSPRERQLQAVVESGNVDWLELRL